MWTATALLPVFLPALAAPVLGALAVLAALAGWDLLLLRHVRPVVCKRQLPERAFVGRAGEVALQLHYDGAHAVELEIVDELPGDLSATEPQFAAVTVAPGAPVTVRYRICPTVRGDRPMGPLIMLVHSPLGLFRRRCIERDAAVLRVYPDAAYFLRPEALDPRRVFAALGVRPSPRRGDGMEFESLRDFVPGDDPRRIDWAAAARRGRLVTRLYQHERNHTVVVAIDASRLMASRVNGRSKLDHAIDAALALTYAALVSGDRASLMVFDNAVRAHLAPRRHRNHLGIFVDMLRTVQPRLVEANYRALLDNLTVWQRQRALVVLLTDFVEVDAAQLIHPLAVLAQRHRVLVVAVRDAIYRGLDVCAPVEADHLDLYRRLVLDDLLREREAALAELRRRGVQTLDLTPEAITAAVLNRYLAVRYGPER